LSVIRQAQMSNTWCVIGDFNVVRSLHEKKGVNNHGMMKDAVICWRKKDAMLRLVEG